MDALSFASIGGIIALIICLIIKAPLYIAAITFAGIYILYYVIKHASKIIFDILEALFDCCGD